MTATIDSPRARPTAYPDAAATPRFFVQMVSRQHLDLESVPWSGSKAMVADALRDCAQCPSEKACRAWLRSARPAMSYVRFCPNAERIETLRIMGL